MSQESSEEKSEDATPKRLREARKKGQVAKSKDLTTIFEMAALFASVCICLGYMGGQLKLLMQRTFQLVGKADMSGPEIYDLGKMAMLTLANVSAPALLAGFLVSLIVGFMQVGPIFSLDPLMPQGKKLNPLEGLKNMFKTTTFIELIKNIIKLTFIFFIAYKVVYGSLYEVLQTARVSVLDGSRVAGDLIFEIVIKVLILFIAIAVADYMVQRWQFMKQMRMTKDEVKREYKQDEGDPHIKSHRKSLHREMVFGDVGQQVKNADAVVTNPVHVAVAIKYDKNEMGAPEIVAKGQRLYAEKIKKLAEENNVPVIRNVALAWSLVELEEGQEVPEELYTAVAEILAIVYKLKQAQEAKKTLRALDVNGSMV